MYLRESILINLESNINYWQWSVLHCHTSHFTHMTIIICHPINDIFKLYHISNRMITLQKVWHKVENIFGSVHYLLPGAHEKSLLFVVYVKYYFWCLVDYCCCENPFLYNNSKSSIVHSVVNKMLVNPEDAFNKSNNEISERWGCLVKHAKERVFDIR